MPILEQFIHTLQDYVKDHAVKLLTGLLLMAIGWFVGRKRALADWKKKEFLDRLNVSLNTIESGTLKIRTLSEKRSEEVFLNSAATDAIIRMARRTTAENPLLPIPTDELWFYLNSVLNDLSEQFADGLLKRDMGGPVKAATYLISLTCESAGAMRTRKIRAMVIQKNTLVNLPEECPKLEATQHGTRWKTLQFLAAEYQKNPAQFLEVELAVP
ncbi:hypothetical protein [Schlesneria paludicola]|uniref:hypothetical protein n=1 Tax=Schlesneria paludicola TaxID=360056 RepID=UPI00029A35F7|nr:hypothetical protein [Schlesneria paludicola]